MPKNDLVVLAVDDDLINLKLLKSLLMRSGLVKEVLEAKNGVDAIGKLKSRDDIDIVLLDLIMPIMGGIEMIQVVRCDENLKQLPIIVLTTDETKKSEALDCGANSFVMKPIKKEELLKKIATVV